MSVSLGFPLVVQENLKYNINLFDLQESGGFDLAKSAVGKDLHHDEMKLLEELELYLLCHVTSNDSIKCSKRPIPKCMIFVEMRELKQKYLFENFEIISSSEIPTNSDSMTHSQ